MPAKYLLINTDTQEIHSTHDSREGAQAVKGAENDKFRHSREAVDQFILGAIRHTDIYNLRNRFGAKHPYWDWYFVYFASEAELRGRLLNMDDSDLSDYLDPWGDRPALYKRPNLIVVPVED